MELFNQVQWNGSDTQAELIEGALLSYAAKTESDSVKDKVQKIAFDFTKGCKDVKLGQWEVVKNGPVQALLFKHQCKKDDKSISEFKDPYCHRCGTKMEQG